MLLLNKHKPSVFRTQPIPFIPDVEHARLVEDKSLQIFLSVS